METSDVKETLERAREFTNLEHVKVKLRPRLLSDNGSSFTSKVLADIQGQTFTFGVWVRTPSANAGRIYLADGVTRVYSNYAANTGQYEWLTGYRFRKR